MNSEPSFPISINDWREELAREKKKNDELTLQFKNQERNYQKLVGELKTQVQSEQQKSLSLENSLQKMPNAMSQVIELQAQLKQAELRQKQLKEELVRKGHEMEAQEKESQKDSLANDLKTFKDFAINEITEKEKVIIEQKLYIENSEKAIQSLTQEIEHYQTLLLSEKQKFQSEIEDYKDIIDQLEEDIFQAKQNSASNKYTFTKHQDEINKHQVANSENQQLKFELESLQEQFEMKVEDLKNAEKKIEHLKKSRLELADQMTELENKVEILAAQKEEIKKGLENKEETIHLLEEEIYSNAEDFAEKLKMELEDANGKCKRLEKQIREMEQNYEDKIEEKLGIISNGQFQVNDLMRKVLILEKDKEGLVEKIFSLQKIISVLENDLIEFDLKKSNEIEKFKDQFKDKLLRLKQEKDELRIKCAELQEQVGFGRPSIVEPGGSLFDEFSQLPEGRFSHLSLRPTLNEDTKRVENLISQLAEKETNLKNLTTEKNNLDIRHKENYTELKKVKQELTIALRNLEHKAQELEMANWELDNLRTSEDSKLDKGKILVLESEKDLLKAEISRLETELMLSKENWAELNNSLYKDLLESQTSVAKAKSEVIKIREENDLLKGNSEISAKKKKRNIGSWFRREA